MKRSSNIKDLCQIAAFTAIISVVSQLSVPMPSGVPMTLQTFIIPLAGVILGTKKGTISSVMYILLGAVGVPVFAGLRGGLDVILNMTGGFIVSFPVLAILAGLGYTLAVKYSSGSNQKVLFYTVITLGLVIGAAVNYLFGTVWFSVVTGNSMMYSFTVCVLPFIPTSLIKVAMVAITGPVLRKAMVRSGVLETA